jgi:putative nucleotidyltransferase with HDIG domain
MNREEAIDLIKGRNPNKNLLKHMLAVEAIMNGLAEYLGENKQLWGQTGLLHDVDYTETQGDMRRHASLAEEILKGKVDDRVIRAIKAHNREATKISPESKMEKALIAADAVSGLIVASALVLPSKKLKDIKPESIGKRFRDKKFAAGSDRERIVFCEELGLTKEIFFEIALRSMQDASDELGL